MRKNEAVVEYHPQESRQKLNNFRQDQEESIWKAAPVAFAGLSLALREEKPGLLLLAIHSGIFYYLMKKLPSSSKITKAKGRKKSSLFDVNFKLYLYYR